MATARRRIGRKAALSLTLGGCALAAAGIALPAGSARAGDGRASSLAPSTIVIDTDDRMSFADYGKAHGIGPAVLAARFGATGVVRCGAAVGTGQIVGSSGVLVTAAHVIFEPGGRPRGQGSSCTFQIDAGGRRQIIPIDVSGVVCGSTEPYAKPAIRDWAVLPLERPVIGARPYPLAGSLAVPGKVVLSSAARSGGVESRSLELCTARLVTERSPSGTREVALDCDAEGGTSGAALLTPTGGFVGIYVGFRSAHPGQPGPFSMSHYNFGVTADGALHGAIAKVAAGAAARGQTLSAAR
ncbi:S1 family peptidase [Ancylobacter lacus]|uniref:S1 family peptidase n=1 Tax=Ancylobacter lacus TaxID=2579970 RepID=UPI001BCE3590|nr:serine protease [Ancylobacter lacus]MBS7537883.1 trypsin-like peptidase domain-containing protein [Ancylobacter lacus]